MRLTSFIFTTLILLFSTNLSLAQLEVGCTDFYACNYDPDATIEVGDICEYDTYAVEVVTSYAFGESFESWNGVPFPVCSSKIASNWMQLENECSIATLSILTEDNADRAQEFYEICLGTNLTNPFIQGCMDSDACNFNPFANLELLGQCSYPLPGLRSPTFVGADPGSPFGSGINFIFDNAGNINLNDLFDCLEDENCDVYEGSELFEDEVVFGCPSSDNFSPFESLECYEQVLIDNGGEWCEDCLDQYYACAESTGCTDQTACNYNPNVDPAPNLESVCVYPSSNEFCLQAERIEVNNVYWFSTEDVCAENNDFSASIPSADAQGKNGWIGDQDVQKELYFSFQPTSNDEVLMISVHLANLSGAFDAQLAVLLGCEDEVVKADDDSGLLSYPSLFLYPGEYNSVNEYVIVIDGKYGDSGTGYLSVQTVDVATPAAQCPGDFDNNNVVNAADLLDFLAAFGESCDG